MDGEWCNDDYVYLRGVIKDLIRAGFDEATLVELAQRCEVYIDG